MSASSNEGGEFPVFTDGCSCEEHRLSLPPWCEQGMTPMNIAFKRIRKCGGKLNLADLGLTTLPPLPENLVELKVDRNH
jgi:hypothetical protein